MGMKGHSELREAEQSQDLLDLPADEGENEEEKTLICDDPMNQVKIMHGDQQKITRATSQLAIIGAKIAPVESLDYERLLGVLFAFWGLPEPRICKYITVFLGMASLLSFLQLVQFFVLPPPTTVLCAPYYAASVALFSSWLCSPFMYDVSDFSHSLVNYDQFRIVENDIFKQDWRSRTTSQILQYVLLKWTLACLVGLMTGITGVAINLAVENVAGYKLMLAANYISQNRFLLAAGILVGSNLVLVLSAALLCAYVGPDAVGSGIPEVKAYLNGMDAPNILSPKTLIVKILGSIGAVAGGLDVGKEGPLVHIGACLAALLSQGGSKHYHLTWRWFRYFKNDRDCRDLVTCGAAAGLAAAFRAPVGGVLFALEEVASWWRSSLLWRAFFTTATVAVVLQTAVSYCGSNHCGLFGHGGLIIYNIGIVTVHFRLVELVPVVLLGIIGGFLGALFTFFNGKIVEFYSLWHQKHGPMVKIFHAVAISLITSACIVGLPLLCTCTVCPSNVDEQCPSQGRPGNFKQFTCSDGQYNDLASLFFNINDDVVRNLFSVRTSNEFQYASLALYLVSSYVLALITYGTPVPSGLFIPVTLIGATYGRLMGMVMRSFISGLSDVDEGLFAVLGAASFLGGSMRMTVSVCVILLELTNNLLMLPFSMLVLLISKMIADLFNHSVYDQILHIKGLPFLDEHPEAYMTHLTAFDVCSRNLVTLNTIENVKNIVDALQMTNHNAFPVIEGGTSSRNAVLYGLILRSHLLVLLKEKKFLHVETARSGSHGEPFRTADFGKPGSGKGMTIHDVELTSKEQEMYVDLCPFTNTSPYTVVDTMSVAKAFTLFRGLGLRHLCVVPQVQTGSPIVGLLSRHDFMPEHILSLFPPKTKQVEKANG